MPKNFPKLAAIEPGGDIVRNAADKKRRRVYRQLNMPLLVATIIAVCVIVGGGFLLYQRQQGRLTQALLARADALNAKEDWSRAAGYYQRYLWVKPNDFEARLKLIDAVEHSVVSINDRRRLIRMLFETIGMASKGADLKLRLADQLLQVGDFARAIQQAEEVRLSAGESNNLEDMAEAQRILAVARAASIAPSTARRPENQDRVRTAAGELVAAVVEFPGDIALVTFTADFLHKYADILPNDELGPAARAKQIMDGLVEAKSDDADAYVARYIYTQKYDPSDDVADLHEALRIDSNHYSALLLVAAQEEDETAASAYLERAIDSAPSQVEAYLQLARLQTRNDHAEQAIATLNRAESAVGERNLDMGQMLVELFLHLQRIPEAEVALDKVDAKFSQLAPGMRDAVRRYYQCQVDLMHAHVAYAKGNLPEAVESLRTALVYLDQEEGGTVSRRRLREKSLLASMMGQLGYWDLAATYWSELASKVADDKGTLRLQAAQAYMSANQPGKAIEHLNVYLNPEDADVNSSWTPDPDAWITLTQALLQQMATVAPRDRDWAEFERTLATAKSLNPDKLELFFAEVDRLRFEATADAKAKAIAMLGEAEQRHRDELGFWRGALEAYLLLGDLERAHNALERYESLEPDAGQRGLRRANYLALAGETKEAEQALSESVKHLDGGPYQRAQMQRVNLLLYLKDVRGAKTLIYELLKESPDDAFLLANGIETAIFTKDLAMAAQWVRRLEAIPTPDGFMSRYYKARLLLERFDDLPAEQRIELGNLVDSIRSLRPGWHGAASMAGRLAFLQGNRRQAIDDFKLAFSLGDRSPVLIERLVTLLNAERRYAEAVAFLAQRSATHSANPKLVSLEIYAAIQQNELDQAVELAKNALEQNPNDANRHVWLASVLAMNDQPAEAEKVLAAAVEQFPKDVRVWSGMFMLHVGQKNADKARGTLEQFLSHSDATGWEDHYFAAQAFQVLGDLQSAQRESKLAVDLNPRHVPSRLLHAKLLLESDVPEATEQFAAVLKLDSTNGEARRQLAVLAASAGSEEDWQRAMELLEDDASTTEDDRDDRLKAILLTRRGRTRSDRLNNMAAARRILDDQISGPDVETIDRVLLARVCEQEAWLSGDLSLLQKAREQYLLLANSTTAAGMPSVGDYIAFLFRQLSRPLDPEIDEGQWETLRRLFIDDAQTYIGEAEAAASALSQDLPANGRLQILEWRTRLHHLTEDDEGAMARLAEVKETQLDRLASQIGEAQAFAAMGALYSIIGEGKDLGQRKESLAWYNRAMSSAPQFFVLLVRELATQKRLSEAVKICLDIRREHQQLEASAASELAQLLSSFPDQMPHFESALPLIEETLSHHGEHVNLLMSVAVLNVTRGKNEDAIALFRRVLAIEPKHVLALNNLATLLGEQPSRRAEAVTLVQQALAARGRMAPLLDTLGTIQISSGDYAGAIQSLEEAVAGGSRDARYFFHLARAYQKANRLDEARVALARSHQLGIGEAILTQSDQALLRDLELNLNVDDAQLETRSKSRPRPPHSLHQAPLAEFSPELSLAFSEMTAYAS